MKNTNLTENAMRLLSSKNEDSQMLGAEMLFYQGEYNDLFRWCEVKLKLQKHKVQTSDGFALRFKGVKFMQYYKEKITVYNTVKKNTRVASFLGSTKCKLSNEKSFKKTAHTPENHKLNILENIAETICNTIEKITELKNN